MVQEQEILIQQFSETDLGRLRDLLNNQKRSGSARPPAYVRDDLLIVFPDAEVPAATINGTTHEITPGTLDCLVYRFDGDVLKRDMTGGRRTVHNTQDRTFPANKALIIHREWFTGRYVVLNTTHKQTAKIGVITGGTVLPGGTADVTVYRGTPPTTTAEVIQAVYDWATGTESISNGKQVFVTWFEDDAVWRITGAECE